MFKNLCCVSTTIGRNHEDAKLVGIMKCKLKGRRKPESNWVNRTPERVRGVIKKSPHIDNEPIRHKACPGQRITKSKKGQKSKKNEPEGNILHGLDNRLREESSYSKRLLSDSLTYGENLGVDFTARPWVQCRLLKCFLLHYYI